MARAPAVRRRTGPRHRRARLRGAAALALALAAAGCVPALPIEGAPCPCDDGYHCCPVENRCLASGAVCPISGNCPLPPKGGSLLDVGTTDLTADVPTFVPLDDAGDMQLVQGPQGGYHVFVQVRLLGLDPTTVTLTRYFCDPLDPVCDQTSALRFQTDSPPMFCDHDVDWVMAEEQLTYLCPSRKQGQAMDGRTLHLRVVATDAGGRRLTADRAIHPNCPPGDTLCATNDVFGCAAP